MIEEKEGKQKDNENTLEVTDNKVEQKTKKKVKNAKKILIKRLLIILGALLAILILDVTVAWGRFELDKHNSSYDKAINDPKTLTIVYKTNCERCRRVLPSLFLKKAFSGGKEYVLDAGHLTPEQKQDLGEHSTPTFSYDGESVQTTDINVAEEIWDHSH